MTSTDSLDNDDVVFSEDNPAVRVLPACLLLAANGGAFFMYSYRNFFLVRKLVGGFG